MNQNNHLIIMWLQEQAETCFFISSCTLHKVLPKIISPVTLTQDPAYFTLVLHTCHAHHHAALRQHLRPGVTIGISGDACAGLGLNAGCEVWYSVCGGLFPETAKQITDAAAAQDHERVTALTARLEPLWALFRRHGGSIRVIAAAAGVLGLTDTDCLPRPLQPLSASDFAEIARVLTTLDLK